MPIKRSVPQRTCVSCRKIGVKEEFVRLVRQPGGGVVVDECGRLPGRGAYICRRGECWQEALVRLEHSLKIRIPPEEREKLLARGREITACGHGA